MNYVDTETLEKSFALTSRVKWISSDFSSLLIKNGKGSNFEDACFFWEAEWIDNRHAICIPTSAQGGSVVVMYMWNCSLHHIFVSEDDNVVDNFLDVLFGFLQKFLSTFQKRELELEKWKCSFRDDFERWPE